MKWDIKNINEIVIFINNQLRKNTSMTDIEKNYFDVNSRVIHKRLLRLGYKKINNQYIKTNEEKNNINFKKDKELVVQKKFKKSVEQKENFKVLDNKNLKEVKTLNDLDINKLKELINLLDPLKELLKNYKDNSKSFLISNLEVPVIKDVKQRTIKVDINVLKNWDTFLEENSNYKAQDLISQALKEFMENHKK